MEPYGTGGYHTVPYGKHGTGWALEKVYKDAHLRLNDPFS
jgi:hypothetical protein